MLPLPLLYLMRIAGQPGDTWRTWPNENPRSVRHIKDVARELGVSIATVSRALSRPHLLRPKTRERVMGAVERLGYRPNLLARGLRQGLAQAILFVAPNLSPFFLEIFAGAEDVTRNSQFALLFGNSNGDPEREQHFFDQVVSGRADGIILLTGAAPSAYASGDRKLPPLVTVSSACRAPRFRSSTPIITRAPWKRCGT